MQGRLIALLLAALVAATAETAGAAGGKQRVYTLDRNEWFWASSSRLSCGAFVPKEGPGKGRMSFECAMYLRSGWPKPRTYGALIGAWGVAAIRYDATGHGHSVAKTFRNPFSTDLQGGVGERAGHAGRDPDVRLRPGDGAFLGSTDVACRARLSNAPGEEGVPLVACSRWQPVQAGWKCCLDRTYRVEATRLGVFVYREEGGDSSFVQGFDNPR